MKICENPPHIDAVVKNERETVSDLPDENVKLNAQPQVTPHIAWACLCYGDDDASVCTVAPACRGATTDVSAVLWFRCKVSLFKRDGPRGDDIK